MTASASVHAQSIPQTSIMMIAWRQECYRSSTTADLFEADLELVWPKSGNGRLGKIVRYLKSFRHTFWLIMDERPDLAIVMNVPAFAPLASQFAAFFTGTKVVLDFHSGGITSSMWNKFTPLYKFICKRAPFTICHNRFDAKTIEEWGGTPFMLTALPKNFDGVDYKPAPADPVVLVICSFKSDEPVDVLLNAMRLCPNVRFEITGNYLKAGLDPDEMPDNNKLLGFVSYDDYVQRMARSTAIITVSDRGHIMQAAVHEALSLGVPVITNNSPTIESVLGDAGVYAAVEPDSLAQAISTAVASAPTLRERMILRKNTLRTDLANLIHRFSTSGTMAS